ARGGHHHSDRSALAGTEFPPLPISDHRLINDKPHPRPRTATGAVPSGPASGTPGSEALRERVVAGQFSVRARDLSTPRDAELLPQDIAMRLRRPWRDAEPLSNLFVRVPGRDQLDDLLLSRSQNGRGRLQHRRHSPDGNKGVLSWLLTKRRIWPATPNASRGGQHRLTPHERSRMPALVRDRQLLALEGADPHQQLELVAQVRPHHLVCRRLLEKKNPVVGESAEGLAHGLL